MKINKLKIFALAMILICLGNAHTYAQSNREETQTELAQSKLNTRRFDKNLERYKTELDLTKKQVKQLSKIDKRYTRLDRKLDRKGGSRKDSRTLATQKREEMIEVLNSQQQEQLEALIKKGRFSFDHWFGK
ncbi:hypothetical protein [Dyadobacter tibetensis]|uniref:hypothetical protein n=1 Tax=Dyadobacter tibetensis TaxID=1211851 RepID=UPI00046ED721|nr:hypothetical protein [Dyadobacter tibetensis]